MSPLRLGKDIHKVVIPFCEWFAFVLPRLMEKVAGYHYNGNLLKLVVFYFVFAFLYLPSIGIQVKVCIIWKLETQVVFILSCPSHYSN